MSGAVTENYKEQWIKTLLAKKKKKPFVCK
jgi:hypothetical protein